MATDTLKISASNTETDGEMRERTCKSGVIPACSMIIMIDEVDFTGGGDALLPAVRQRT